MQQLIDEARLEFLAWLALAGVGGTILLVLRLVRPKWFEHLIPPQRHRAVPWTWFEVTGVFMLTQIFAIVLANELLTQAGFFTRYYGPDFPLSLTPDASSEQQLSFLRRSLWMQVLAFPFQLFFLFSLLRMSSEIEPYQFGLTRTRAGKDAILGYLGWLGLAPLVLGVNFLVLLAYQRWRPQLIEQHSLVRLLEQGQPFPAELVLIVLIAVVFAPIIEELFFRGVLQPYLALRSYGGDLALAAAFVISLTSRYDKLLDAFNQQGVERFGLMVDALSPGMFVLAAIPPYIFIEYLTWRWIPQPHVARAIFGTSLLFASFHANVWPSPIALFPLALGLGFLAYRTQSVIGSIVLHSLFNAISVISVIWTAFHPKG